ncbi:hypothetical protein CR513_00952, partial [Mucuna pruriens]
MAIVMEGGSTEFIPSHLAETVLDKSLPRPYRTSLYREQLGLQPRMTKNTLISPTLQETELDQSENIRAIVWKTTISVRTESRALCSSKIRTCIEYASRISRLPKAKSVISSTTIPTAATATTAATAENATSRQFTTFGGPDEATCSQQFGVSAICKLQQHAIPAKYEHHRPRPQDIPQSSLTNNSESKREHECSYAEKRKRTISTCTTADSKLDANTQVQQQEKTVPLLFPTRIVSARKSESDEELLKMFRKVEINTPRRH